MKDQADASPISDAHMQAFRLAQEALIVDGHIDVPYRLHTFWEDVTRPTVCGDFDLPRARLGGLSAAFWAIYLPASLQSDPGASKALADTQLDLIDDLLERARAQLMLATTPRQIREAANNDTFALCLGIENGSALEGTPRNVYYYFNRGVRYITLTHSRDNALCDSSYDDTKTHGGLSALGREVVAEMNRLGMMVDISHASDAAALDVLDMTDVPVVATHSSAPHFTPGWKRNLHDELLQGVAETGGIVMVCFGSPFLNDRARNAQRATKQQIKNEIRALGLSEESATARCYTERARKERPTGSVADVADHIDYIAELIGVEHVGWGSDFDGIFGLPAGLQDVSMYPNLIRELLNRGYSRADIKKIAGENVLRVWQMILSEASN